MNTVLGESGDCFQGNDTSGQIDFTGPTSVAGNTNWTNYALSVRIRPSDDDGHGVVLRYRDSTNFYRIALRSQSSTTGPAQGLSIQKCVNRVYSEVYRDSPVKYNPVAGTAYDLVSWINGTALNVLLVSDPEGAAQPYTYGPFTVTGVSNGKIGVFSWAPVRL